MEKAAPKKKVGLALGGGGAKGLAHIGVIKELERAGVEISFIAGTSMGALVGAWYAATKDIRALEELFLSVSSDDVVPVHKLVRKQDGNIFKDPSIPAFYESRIGAISFDECKIPFKATATDAKNGDLVILDKGNVMDAVRASTALPIVFKPVMIDGKMLMDGGFVNPVPADIVKGMGADFVIAVDVSSKWTDFSEQHLMDMLHVYGLVSHALSVIEYQIAKRVLAESADVVMNPPVLSYHWMEFGNARDIIRCGAREAHSHLAEIYKGANHTPREKSSFEKFMDFILYTE